MSFIIMYFLGINANIMSLGGIAIAIGVMVDASVVLGGKRPQTPATGSGVKSPIPKLSLTQSKEVGPALFYSLLIITV